MGFCSYLSVVDRRLYYPTATIYKFDTLKELVQFQSDYREALSLDKVLDKTPSFYQATSKYDRKFFKTAR